MDLPDRYTRHDWRDQAACHGQPLDLFYRHEEARNATHRAQLATHALALCEHCPVRNECYEDALTDTGTQHGIRGGTFAADRTAAVYARRARSA